MKSEPGKKFERITKVGLPFDMRHEDPTENYGAHGLDVWFILKGPAGAVQFMVSFGVYLPSVMHVLPGKITGFDVGYHSPVPMYEGQRAHDCDIIDEGKCYYDGSSLRAQDWSDEIFATVGRRPEEVLWPMMESEYHDRFEGAEEAMQMGIGEKLQLASVLGAEVP